MSGRDSQGSTKGRCESAKIKAKFDKAELKWRLPDWFSGYTNDASTLALILIKHFSLTKIQKVKVTNSTSRNFEIWFGPKSKI